jgi:hypothetical protein
MPAAHPWHKPLLTCNLVVIAVVIPSLCWAGPVHTSERVGRRQRPPHRPVNAAHWRRRGGKRQWCAAAVCEPAGWVGMVLAKHSIAFAHNICDGNLGSPCYLLRWAWCSYCGPRQIALTAYNCCEACKTWLHVHRNSQASLSLVAQDLHRHPRRLLGVLRFERQMIREFAGTLGKSLQYITCRCQPHLCKMPFCESAQHAV